MKYCSKCGKELVDEAVICTSCGCYVVQPQQNPIPTQYPLERSNNQGLQTAALVFMFLSIGFTSLIAFICLIASPLVGFFWAIPLCWYIPMTVSYKNKIKTGQPISTAFCVCTLLFLNLISGILMLCDNNR